MAYHNNNCVSAVPPSAPEDLFLEGFGATWIAFSWFFQIPIEIKIIFHILVSRGGMEWDITVDGDDTTVNVTDLLPGTEYVFRVTALASDGQLSPPSTPLITTTAFPRMCISIVVLSVIITVALHTQFYSHLKMWSPPALVSRGLQLRGIVLQ